jgi:hypothetical protein
MQLDKLIYIKELSGNHSTIGHGEVWKNREEYQQRRELPTLSH